MVASLSDDAQFEEEEEWEGETDATGDDVAEGLTVNKCRWATKTKEYRNSANSLYSFCGEDEEHDPNEEFEEILSCSVCGDIGMFVLTRCG
jgi:histone acetyltransferase SAS3